MLRYGAGVPGPSSILQYVFYSMGDIASALRPPLACNKKQELVHVYLPLAATGGRGKGVNAQHFPIYDFGVNNGHNKKMSANP